MKCRLCNTPLEKPCVEQQILNRYHIKYYRCQQCDLLQTEYPFWLDEAYSDSINISDTGLVARNLQISNYLISLFIVHFGILNLKNLNCIDLGGGYGLLVRLMRDKGINFFWSDKYTKNLLARGFEGIDMSYDVAVSFEVLEHLVDIEKELSFTFNKASFFVFSTTLYDQSVPDSNWHYYGLNHGQHINFFSVKTLHYIATKYGLDYLSDGNLHVFSRRKLKKNTLLLSKILSKIPLRFILRLFLKTKVMSDHYLMLGD